MTRRSSTWRRFRRLRGTRRGLSLVEVLVAVVLAGVCASGLAGMAYQASKSAMGTAFGTARLSSLTSLAERLGVMDFDALPAAAGCSSTGDGPFSSTNCIRVEDLSTRLRRVTILVRPNREGLASADSVVFARSRTAPPSPF